jgi:hypothetical protein
MTKKQIFITVFCVMLFVSLITRICYRVLGDIEAIKFFILLLLAVNGCVYTALIFEQRQKRKKEKEQDPTKEKE